jgi:hypothetical protein
MHGRFTGRGLAIGLLGGIAVGVLWAWWAEVAQRYLAPIFLFPLLIGAGVGVTVVGLARITQIGHRPSILLSALIAAILAALAQHYVTYLGVYYWHHSAMPGEQATGQDLSAIVNAHLITTFADYLQAQVRRGRPLAFGYVAQGWTVWLTWGVDSLLTVTSAVAATLLAIRTPYCNQCRSWYRVTRNGKIDLATAKRLAARVDATLPEHTRSQRYRMSNCHNGCSPTCCELSWEEATGQVALMQFWLDAAGRSEISAILDGIASETDEDEDDEET